MEEQEIESPVCDYCETNEFVVWVGPDTFGSSFHCTRCETSWVQES